MSRLYKMVENDRCVLKIFHDDNPDDPRDWDNVGTMVCFHRRYDLGDNGSANDFIYSLASDLGIDVTVPDEDGDPVDRDVEEVFSEVNNRIALLPLYLYDHSGITMSTMPFACKWDSDQVGYIYCTLEKAREEYGDVPDVIPDSEAIAIVENHLQSEVEIYDMYLTGRAYGFELREKKIDSEGEVYLDKVDDGWGFYTDDPLKDIVDDCVQEEWRAGLE